MKASPPSASPSHGRAEKAPRPFVARLWMILALVLVAGSVALYFLAGRQLGEDSQGVRNVTTGLIERDIPPAPPDPEPEEPRAEEPEEPAGGEEAAPEEEADRELEPIELAMQQPPGMLRGWTIAESGDYLQGAEVRLQFEDLVEGGKAGPDLRRTTDSAGVFDFDAVPPGSWTLIAEHPDHGAETLAGIVVQSDEMTDNVEIVIPAAVTLKGQVRTTTGIALEGARVQLRRKTLRISRADGEIVTREVAYRESQTDSKGNFAIERAGPGPHAVQVSLEGFATERVDIVLEREGENSVEIELSPAASIGGLVRSSQGLPIGNAEIALKDPRLESFNAKTKTKPDGSFVLSGLRANRNYLLTAKAANFALAGPIEIPAGRMNNLIVMESGGAISGRITNLNTGGTESRIAVVLESTARAYQLQLLVRSDSQGLYRFGDLPSGTYNLRISSEELTSEPRLGVKVKIPEETRDVDFQIYPGKTITGIVAESETGSRIRGAKVSVESRVGPEFLSKSKSTVYSDEGGTFRVTNLPYGLYQLEATADGYLRYPGPEAQAQVELLPGDMPEPVTLLLSPGGTIRGTVADAGGSPVEGAVVQLYNSPGARARINTGRFRAVTNTGGQYEITGIPLDQEVNVTASAYAAAKTMPGDKQGATSGVTSYFGLAKGKSDPVVLTPFLSTAEANIRLGIGAPVTVRVEDQGGTGLDDANVSLNHNAFPGDPSPPDWSGKTSSLGRITFHSIPAGNGSVSASKSGYIGAGSSFQVADGQPTQVTLKLEKGTSIEGIVVDDAGLPIQEGHVDARAERGSRGGGRGSIDSRGHFKIDGVSEGFFTLSVNAVRQTPSGKHTVRRDVSGVHTRTQPTITVPMNGRVDGIVLDQATLEPITSASVRLSGRYEYQRGRATNFSSNTNTSNPPGEFTFQNLPPGEYSLSVSAGNYLPQQISEIEVYSPGTHHAGKILLSKGSVLKGRVLSAENGEPVVSASVKLVPNGPGGKSGGDGRFTISAIPEGMYDLEVSHGEYLPKTVKLIQIRHDGEADAGVIELDAGGKLYGRVTDGFNRPVAGASVTVRYIAEDIRRSGKTDAGGIVRMQGLKPGAVLVTVTGNFKRGKLTKSLDMTISANQESKFEVVLAGELTLQGSIIGPDGSWVAAPLVQIYPLEADDRPVLNGMIQAEMNGSYFRATEMVEGRYLLAISGNWRGQVLFWHMVVDLRYPGANVTARAAHGEIGGRIFDPRTNEPLSGMNVRLRGLSFPQSNIHALRKWWEWTTVSGENGGYRFSNVAPGTYELVVTEPGSTNAYMEIISLTTWGQSLTYNVAWED